MDIIYHFMPASWKITIIEEGFSNADSTVKEVAVIFETRVENLEPEENEKKVSIVSKKKKDKSALKKALKRKKKGDSNSTVTDSS